ncbi:MAG: glycosyltransferase family 4 protein [Patescibacteria group bacterium]
MKVGLFNPYFDTMGGGERYFLTTAEYFLQKGYQTDIFWNGDQDVTKIKTRFNLDLTGVNFVWDIFTNENNRLKKFFLTAKYDLIFFISDGSIPFSLAKKNILHFQVPFNHKSHRNIQNTIKLRAMSHIVCNSAFTKSYIDKSYGVESQVIYPPVDIESFFPKKKENIILSVGRFFGPTHPKKQEVLIREFVSLCKKGLKNWRLVLIGGLTAGGEGEIERLRQKSLGHPVRIITDSSFAVLKEHYAKAKIYWHATGFGEDLEKFPEKAEHFGITTVEAMSAGCVPIVFAGGGQTEIVREGMDGFFWGSTQELADKTEKLADSTTLLRSLSKQAIFRSQIFSKKEFFKSWDKLLD